MSWTFLFRKKRNGKESRETKKNQERLDVKAKNLVRIGLKLRGTLGLVLRFRFRLILFEILARGP